MSPAWGDGSTSDRRPYCRLVEEGRDAGPVTSPAVQWRDADCPGLLFVARGSTHGRVVVQIAESWHWEPPSSSDRPSTPQSAPQATPSAALRTLLTLHTGSPHPVERVAVSQGRSPCFLAAATSAQLAVFDLASLLCLHGELGRFAGGEVCEGERHLASNSPESASEAPSRQPSRPLPSSPLGPRLTRALPCPLAAPPSWTRCGSGLLLARADGTLCMLRLGRRTLRTLWSARPPEPRLRVVAAGVDLLGPCATAHEGVVSIWWPPEDGTTAEEEAGDGGALAPSPPQSPRHQAAARREKLRHPCSVSWLAWSPPLEPAPPGGEESQAAGERPPSAALATMGEDGCLRIWVEMVVLRGAEADRGQEGGGPQARIAPLPATAQPATPRNADGALLATPQSPPSPMPSPRQDSDSFFCMALVIPPPEALPRPGAVLRWGQDLASRPPLTPTSQPLQHRPGPVLWLLSACPPAGPAPAHLAVHVVRGLSPVVMRKLGGPGGLGGGVAASGGRGAEAVLWGCAPWLLEETPPGLDRLDSEAAWGPQSPRAALSGRKEADGAALSPKATPLFPAHLDLHALSLWTDSCQEGFPSLRVTLSRAKLASGFLGAAAALHHPSPSALDSALGLDSVSLRLPASRLGLPFAGLSAPSAASLESHGAWRAASYGHGPPLAALLPLRDRRACLLTVDCRGGLLLWRRGAAGTAALVALGGVQRLPRAVGRAGESFQLVLSAAVLERDSERESGRSPERGFAPADGTLAARHRPWALVLLGGVDGVRVAALDAPLAPPRLIAHLPSLAGPEDQEPWEACRLVRLRRARSGTSTLLALVRQAGGETRCLAWQGAVWDGTVPPRTWVLSLPPDLVPESIQPVAGVAGTFVAASKQGLGVKILRVPVWRGSQRPPLVEERLILRVGTDVHVAVLSPASVPKLVAASRGGLYVAASVEEGQRHSHLVCVWHAGLATIDDSQASCPAHFRPSSAPTALHWLPGCRALALAVATRDHGLQVWVQTRSRAWACVAQSQGEAGGGSSLLCAPGPNGLAAGVAGAAAPRLALFRGVRVPEEGLEESDECEGESVLESLVPNAPNHLPPSSALSRTLDLPEVMRRWAGPLPRLHPLSLAAEALECGGSMAGVAEELVARDADAGPGKTSAQRSQARVERLTRMARERVAGAAARLLQDFMGPGQSSAPPAEQPASMQTGMLDMAAFGMGQGPPSHPAASSMQTGMLDMAAFGMGQGPPAQPAASSMQTGMLDMAAFGMGVAAPASNIHAQTVASPVSTKPRQRTVAASELFPLTAAEAASLSRALAPAAPSPPASPSAQEVPPASVFAGLPRRPKAQLARLARTLAPPAALSSSHLPALDTAGATSLFLFRASLCELWSPRASTSAASPASSSVARVVNAAGVSLPAALTPSTLAGGDGRLAPSHQSRSLWGMLPGLGLDFLLWANASETQPELLDYLLALLPPEVGVAPRTSSQSATSFQPSQPAATPPPGAWARLAACGTGLWLREGSTARAQVEQVARATFAASRRPDEVALWYVAQGRVSALASLYRASQNARLANFLSRDFGVEEHRVAAGKNAFVLLGQRRVQLAAAFFLLQGSLSDAVGVLARAGEAQLAGMLCALRAGDGGGDPGALETLHAALGRDLEDLGTAAGGRLPSLRSRLWDACSACRQRRAGDALACLTSADWASAPAALALQLAPWLALLGGAGAEGAPAAAAAGRACMGASRALEGHGLPRAALFAATTGAQALAWGLTHSGEPAADESDESSDEEAGEDEEAATLSPLPPALRPLLNRLLALAGVPRLAALACHEALLEEGAETRGPDPSASAHLRAARALLAATGVSGARCLRAGAREASRLALAAEEVSCRADPAQAPACSRSASHASPGLSHSASSQAGADPGAGPAAPRALVAAAGATVFRVEAERCEALALCSLLSPDAFGARRAVAATRKRGLVEGEVGLSELALRGGAGGAGGPAAGDSGPARAPETPPAPPQEESPWLFARTLSHIFDQARWSLSEPWASGGGGGAPGMEMTLQGDYLGVYASGSLSPAGSFALSGRAGEEFRAVDGVEAGSRSVKISGGHPRAPPSTAAVRSSPSASHAKPSSPSAASPRLAFQRPSPAAPPAPSGILTAALASHPTRPLYLSGDARGFVHLWHFGAASVEASFSPVPAAELAEAASSASLLSFSARLLGLPWSAARWGAWGRAAALAWSPRADVFAGLGEHGVLAQWSAQSAGRRRALDAEGRQGSDWWQPALSKAGHALCYAMEGGVLVAGGLCSGGNVSLWDVRLSAGRGEASAAPMLNVAPLPPCVDRVCRNADPVHALCAVGDHALAVGTAEGALCLLDLRMLGGGGGALKPSARATSPQASGAERSLVWSVKAANGCVRGLAALSRARMRPRDERDAAPSLVERAPSFSGPAGAVLVTASMDGGLRLWDGGGGALLQTLDVAHPAYRRVGGAGVAAGPPVPAPLGAVAVCADGVVTAGADGAVKLFEFVA